MRPIDETSAEYYITLEVADRPGVLHAVTGVFAAHDVSIRAAEQEGLGDEARLVFITHNAREADVQATLRDLRDLDVVQQRRQHAARHRQLAREVRQHPRRGAGSASPTCCSPAWPPTAACTSRVVADAAAAAAGAAPTPRPRPR